MDGVEKRMVEALYRHLVLFFADGSGSTCGCCGYIMSERGTTIAKHLLGCELAVLYEMVGGKVTYLERAVFGKSLRGLVIAIVS